MYLLPIKPENLLRIQFVLYGIKCVIFVGYRQSGKSAYLNSIVLYNKQNKITNCLYFARFPNRPTKIWKPTSSINAIRMISQSTISNIIVDDIFDIKDEDLITLLKYINISDSPGILVGTGTMPKQGTVLYDIISTHFPEILL